MSHAAVLAIVRQPARSLEAHAHSLWGWLVGHRTVAVAVPVAAVGAQDRRRSAAHSSAVRWPPDRAGNRAISILRHAEALHWHFPPRAQCDDVVSVSPVA